MRARRLDEVVIAARCLQRMPKSARAGQAALWIKQCHCADKYRKRRRKLHPNWGNGSLLGRLDRGELPGSGALSDPDFLRSLIVMLSAVEAWQLSQSHR